MQINLENVGKKFNRDWIIRQANYTFHTGEIYAITGPNGSGKSTLLQLIAGLMPLTEGQIRYQSNNQQLPTDDIFRQLTIAAPYLELIEEFSLVELLDFHCQFKPFKEHLSNEDFLDITFLKASRHKLIKHFSSGMKTRAKLGLAFLSNAPLLLLDEPTSNLDASGIAWYKQMLLDYSVGRLVIICSNQPYEYENVSSVLSIKNAYLEF